MRWNRFFKFQLETFHFGRIENHSKYQSYIPIEEVLQWSTLNGAEALGMDDWAGSFELNKKPGILWIQNFKKLNDQYLFEEDARVSRLF